MTLHENSDFHEFLNRRGSHIPVVSLILSDRRLELLLRVVSLEIKLLSNKFFRSSELQYSQDSEEENQTCLKIKTLSISDENP